MVLDHTFTGPELTAALRRAKLEAGKHVVRYTLDDLDELLGFVAAEANHSTDKKLRKELDALCARVRREMEALGNFQAAFVSAREALRVATDIQHPTSLAVANRYLGYVHSLRGEMDTAVPFLESALAIARDHDLLYATIFTLAHLAYALVLLGERERGLECLTRARERSTGVVMPRWYHYSTVMASAYLAAGCAEQARTEIRRGLAVASERDAWGHRASWLRLEAQVLAQEDLVGAGARLEEALRLATETGIRLEVGHCHLGLGRLYRRTGNLQQVREHLTTATTLYREMDMRFWLKQAEAEMGELA